MPKLFKAKVLFVLVQLCKFGRCGAQFAVSPRLLIEWCQRRQQSACFLDGATLVLKSVGESHLPAIAFAALDNHCYMYKSAAWV